MAGFLTVGLILLLIKTLYRVDDNKNKVVNNTWGLRLSHVTLQPESLERT